jgi:hypothetical protein
MEEGAKHVFHQGLECCRCIGIAEWHHQELEVPVMRAKRRLGDVLKVHAHLVVPRMKVKIGEEACPMELVEELVNHRDRELAFGSLGVESSIVDAELP